MAGRSHAERKNETKAFIFPDIRAIALLARDVRFYCNPSESFMRRDVIRFIHRERLVSPGDTVLLGVSGGADSLCLMHLLHACQAELGITLHVAHLNHLIRGADAEADAQFVADFAAQLGIPCTVQSRDVRAVARERQLGIEEAARRVRYAFLFETAREIKAARIAVGHNADDQSETILMHWLRGAGLAGLRGMLPATPLADLRLLSPSTSGKERWLIRPLLQTPRADIERYCRAHDLQPRCDRSNLDTTFYRNKLRHELLPHLEKAYKPNLRVILRRSAQVIRDDYDLLCTLRDDAWDKTAQVSDRVVVFDRAVWQTWHVSLQRAMIRRAVQHLRRNLRDVNFEHVDAAVRVAHRGAVGAQATLPRRVVLTVGYTRLFIAEAGLVPPPDFPALTVERLALTIPGVTLLPPSGRVEVNIVPVDRLPPDWEQNVDPWRAFLDAGVVGRSAFLRRRRAGDRFCPLGMGGRQKLVSELLVNARLTAWWRDLVPLLIGQDGEIIWVCGWRVDERAKITEHTSHVAIIHFM